MEQKSQITVTSPLLPNLEELRNDTRFYIDDFNLNRLFSKGGVYNYEVVSVRVGSILRSLDGKITSLYDTDVYPYLKGTELGIEKYNKYCVRCNTDRRTPENYNKLVEEFADKEYDIHKGAIVINEQNFILDGQHRSCLLLYKYGPFYEVPVVRVSFCPHVSLCRRLRLVLIRIMGNVRHFDEIIASLLKRR